MRKRAFVFLIAAMAVPAAAQFSTAPMPSWYDYGTMRQQTINGINLRDRIGRPAIRTQRPREPVPPRLARGTTTFPVMRAYIVPARLAAAVQPRRQAEAAAFYTRLLDAHASMVRRKGAPANDVARAASFALSTYYYVLHDGAQLDDAELEGLRHQMTRIFLQDPAFQRLGPRDRQIQFENYVIQSMAIGAVYDQARTGRDNARLAVARNAAREALEVWLGVPVSRLRFGRDGISVGG